MTVIFLIIFAALSAVYLVSLFFKQGKFQAVAKTCLMPLVLAVYASGANRVFFPVLLGLLFGWAGDILLLKIEKPLFFRLGLGSFLLGHLCYIVSFFYFIETLSIPVFVISLLAAVPMDIFVYRLVRPNREMTFPAIAYEVIIFFMLISAIQFFIAWRLPSGALVLAGGISFLVSDSLLAFNIFHKKSSRLGVFLVMLTYITAQFCITLGLSGI